MHRDQTLTTAFDRTYADRKDVPYYRSPVFLLCCRQASAFSMLNKVFENKCFFMCCMSFCILVVQQATRIREARASGLTGVPRGLYEQEYSWHWHINLWNNYLTNVNEYWVSCWPHEVMATQCWGGGGGGGGGGGVDKQTPRKGKVFAWLLT